MRARLRLARPDVGEAEIDAVAGVIRSGWLTQGPVVAEFETAMASRCGAAGAVAVSSCTAALHLALLCAGVGAGDEVIAPSMSFIATANAIVHAGATPVFAEVNPDDFNLDLEDVAARITPRTRAIMLVHQLGVPADIEGFQALATSHGLQLVEDAACAIGSAYHGRPIGGHSRFVCFSFHPRKVVTTGDGGMVLTSAPDDATRLRRLRQHGMSVSDLDRHQSDAVAVESYEEVGYNYRLTDIQASIGLAQLRRLDAILAVRRRLASIYDEVLAGDAVIRTPVLPDATEWNVQTYAVRLLGFDRARRDEVMRALSREDIDSRAGVMTAHREPAYAAQRVRLPVSEAASDSSLMLPLHAGMSDDDCTRVGQALREAVAASA